jgi:hypothetical protein
MPGLVTPHTIMLPPLSPAAYRDVITKPAAVYTRQVARLDLEPELVEALVKGASGADALPLLAFTLQRLFLDYAPEQTLTKAHYDAMGGIEGSIDRKLGEAKAKAGAAGTDANLRRLIVPALATWDPAANAAKRLVPNEADVVGGDHAGLAPLANALVEARLLTRGGGTLEVAHEMLLRRQPISSWLEEQKDALKLRDDVLREAKEWADGGRRRKDRVRRSERLQEARKLAKRSDFRAPLAPARAYLAACWRSNMRGRLIVGALITLIIVFVFSEIGNLLLLHLSHLSSQNEIRRLAQTAADNGRFAEALSIDELIAGSIEKTETEREGKPGEATARELGNLAWRALFARDFAKALTAADRALSLYPGLLWVETDRGHALLFLGRIEEAKTLYLAHKGEKVPMGEKFPVGEKVPDNADKLWEQVIAEDFAEFRKVGLTNPVMADIETALGIVQQ